jgi:WD40 repeat protein
MTVTETRPNTPSIAERSRIVEADSPVVAIHHLGGAAGFVLGEEVVLLVSGNEERRVPVHGGAILTAASDGARIITGGDDGRIAATNGEGESEIIASDQKSRWIDHVATGSDGAVAWSAGKTVFVRTGKGEIRTFDLVSSAGGLAFAPKGFRLAIAHYNGATLWFPNAQAKPEFLEWKGSHLGVALSPDGRFLITMMQEPMLHGWRLMDSKHMRMSGYATRVRSIAFTASGDYLATGGSDQLILWPFQGKDGPMGKQPKLLAPHSARLAVVACHPKEEAVAAGYADGMVLLVRVADGAEILAKRPGAAPVSALAFSPDGASLAFGCEDGTAGLVSLK